ncbi:MAG TPA: outer membrane beta-barrel protein [Chitinophagaceae bacterium]|nr:outer membrane beta-barrel protein [Chitinophagaceae bacterium]
MLNKRHRLIIFKFVFFIALILITGPLQSQDITVNIKAVNSKKEPVAYASIIIKSRIDTTVELKQSADSNGSAQFNLSKGLQCTIRVSAINYQPAEKKVTIHENQQPLIFILEPAGKVLENVVITAQKPLMKQEDDKTIVDPENLVATSTSGYEVIEKTPGLFVDQDGNIYISSLSPAAVQINGRNMRMSAADIATLLKSLPPSSIAKIEIVRTPSAKYDASGSGGVVNVVLKKGIRIGMTGSINGGFQQGIYGNQYAGITINNNDGRKSATFTLNYNHRNSFEQIITQRIFAPDSVLQQDAYTRYPGNNIYSSFGITYDLTKKWELTYDASISYNRFDNNSQNDNNLSKISTGTSFSNSLNTVVNNGSSLTAGTGFETKYKIDSAGSEWTNDLWYSHSINKSDQDFLTAYSRPFPFIFGGDGTAKNDRDYFNYRSDLKIKMKKKFTFESGVQSFINNFYNRANYFREANGVRSNDKNRTNTFRYNENINAAYLQGSQTLGKDFVIKVGTRLENTNMKGRQLVPGDTSFTIHRTDLFPYIYLSKNLVRIAGFDLRAYLIYRRSIRRPYYDQLNPFSRYVDEFLSEVGNPALRPQFTQNYEANVSVNDRPILAVGVNDTKDIFTNVIYQADTSQSQAYRTYDNLGKNKEFYLRGLGAIPPGGKYFFVLGAQYNHNFYEGFYENKPLSFKRGSWTFFTYQTLKVDKRSVITLNGFYRLKGQQQFYELSTFGALNLSINRKFMNEKLTLTLSLNDMFYTNKNDFSINQGSVNATGTRLADTRRLGLNIRYNFGIRKKEDNNNNMFNAEPPVSN